MFIKYGNDTAFEVSKEEELDVKQEFSRQRKFLEQSINNLKKHANVSVKNNDSYGKIMEENIVLVREIDKLRQELRSYHKKCENLELVIKLRQNKKHTKYTKINNNNH